MIFMSVSMDTLKFIRGRSNMEEALNFVLIPHFELLKSIKIKQLNNQIIVRMDWYRVKVSINYAREILYYINIRRS